MLVIQGLVGPNQVRKSNEGKGKKANIPLLFLYAWQHKFDFRRIGVGYHDSSVVLTKINHGSVLMTRT